MTKLTDLDRYQKFRLHCVAGAEALARAAGKARVAGKTQLAGALEYEAFRMREWADDEVMKKLFNQ